MTSHIHVRSAWAEAVKEKAYILPYYISIQVAKKSSGQRACLATTRLIVGKAVHGNDTVPMKDQKRIMLVFPVSLHVRLC